MRLILVRHAQTSANIDGVWHGSTDTPLSDLGQKQIKALSSCFHQVIEPTVIYASPLQRARLTAEAIGDQFSVVVQTDERLMEHDAGVFEDVSYEKLKEEFTPRLLADEHYAPPGGESRFQVMQRMIAAIEEIADKHEGESIVIVSHGMAMTLVLTHWFGDEETKLGDFHKANTSITEIELNPPRLISFNQTPHLTDELKG